MALPPFDLRRLRLGVALVALFGLLVARAAAFTFSEGLSADERTACGLTKLTAPQLAALNADVDRDTTLAHQGGVTGFSSAFSLRLTPERRTAAGLGRLTEKERAFLDTMAARAIAMGPPPSQAFAYVPSTPLPAPPVPPPQEVLSAPPSLQIHGDLSFTVGGGSHGSSFYGTSTDIFITDPSGKYTVGVGVSEFRSRGFIGPFVPLCLEPPLP